MTNTPDIVSGIVGYEQLGDLSSLSFKVVQNSKNLVKFTITVTNSGAAKLYYLKISYLALYDQFSNVFPISVTYQLSDLVTLLLSR